MNKFSLETLWHKKFGDRTFYACVNMSFLIQGGIIKPEFLHENNDHPVSQVLDMPLRWNLGSLLDQRSWFMTSSVIFCWSHQKWFWSVKYTWDTWHDWWRYQSISFIKDHPRCKFQLHSICRTWDTRGRGVQQKIVHQALSLTHSLTHSLSLTLDLGKCPKLFYLLITTLFTPFF